MKTSNIKRLGMPPYISSGSHEYKGEKYRFLVMEKYGKDIWKCYLENDKKFPDLTVYKIGIQVVSLQVYKLLQFYYIYFIYSWMYWNIYIAKIIFMLI